jgi:hypothetical protein
VVDALFYNFAPGEVARHIPKVWRTTTPEAAIAARQMGCATALRRILGEGVDAPAFARAADLSLEAATSAPFEGRPMYAALRAIPIPDDVVARFFHAASLLREHRDRPMSMTMSTKAFVVDTPCSRVVGRRVDVAVVGELPGEVVRAGFGF